VIDDGWLLRNVDRVVVCMYEGLWWYGVTGGRDGQSFWWQTD